ncbi:AAA family ATPase [Geomicrobium sediminis]|uniref:ATP-binding protein involved in virulence n=1 Tax=Geomicrobium sediminis TaxID=1347788 RepID=A0ABS2PFS8_9BACL|nr:AAA family ATPase [Geomicrobium sediminis]MBM7634294.1 putative ATP-binding protein involved in virulence [Geomicrobium sediminis]
MKLKEISIKKLFGIFNHEIKLSIDRGITIVIGENGLGKTKILEMVEAFFKGEFYKLANIEYESLIFKFEDNVSWEIFKNETQEKEVSLSVSQKRKGKKEEVFLLELDVYNPEAIRREAMHIARGSNTLRRSGPNTWEHRYTGELYNSLEIVERYSANQPRRFDNDSIKNSDSPQWFIDRFEKVQVSLIETQRVYNFGNPDRAPIETVRKYSRELTESIKQKLTESTELSSKLDRTYPNRLVNELKEGNRSVSESDLNDELKALEDKRSLLDEVGLVETDKNSDLLLIDKPEDTVKNVLMLYVKDSFDKLSIFDEIAEKIRLLLKIINERFKHKKLYVNKEDGFAFKSTVLKEGDIYRQIPLEQLSSGEKNELILFYHLIFNTSPNSLILIDEPEISLHISWQNKFISDLKEIHNLNKLDILIATHSPDIISNNWDLKVELQGVE